MGNIIRNPEEAKDDINSDKDDNVDKEDKEDQYKNLISMITTKKKDQQVRHSEYNPMLEGIANFEKLEVTYSPRRSRLIEVYSKNFLSG
jgi:hypothetical protein